MQRGKSFPSLAFLSYVFFYKRCFLFRSLFPQKNSKNGRLSFGFLLSLSFSFSSFLFFFEPLFLVSFFRLYLTFFLRPSQKHDTVTEDWKDGKPTTFSCKRKIISFFRLIFNQCMSLLFLRFLFPLGGDLSFFCPFLILKEMGKM